MSLTFFHIWLQIKIVTSYQVHQEYWTKHFVNPQNDYLVPFLNNIYPFMVWTSNELRRYLLKLVNGNTIPEKYYNYVAQTPTFETLGTRF